MIPQTITIACGSTADFDDGAGYGYRCNSCGAVIGSVGMPRVCYDLEKAEQEKKEIWKILNKV